MPRTLTPTVVMAALLSLAGPKVGEAQEARARVGGDDASPVDAAPFASARLRWVRLAGAESCLSQAELEPMVESRLGREVFESGALEPDVDVAGSVQPEVEGGWRATLVLLRSAGDLGGVREISIPSGPCEDLAESVALVLSLMVDMPSPRTLIRLPEPVVPDDAASSAAAWRLTAGVRSDLLLWPVAVVGPSVGLSAFVGERWSLDLSLFGGFSTTAERSGIEWAVSQAGVGLALRGAFVRGPSWDLGISAGGEWSGLFVGTQGLQELGNAAGSFALATSTLWLERRVGERHAIRVHLGVGLPLTRYRFAYGSVDDERRTLIRTGGVGLRILFEVVLG